MVGYIFPGQNHHPIHQPPEQPPVGSAPNAIPHHQHAPISSSVQPQAVNKQRWAPTDPSEVRHKISQDFLRIITILSPFGHVFQAKRYLCSKEKGCKFNSSNSQLTGCRFIHSA